MKNWSITIVIFGVFVVFSMVYFALIGFNPETLDTQIRLSARTSFLLFAITFAAYPLFTIMEKNSTEWLYNNRKYLGVSFALIHFYHLGLLIAKDYAFESIFDKISPLSLFGGIITYTFIGLLFLTSFPVISKNLSEDRWPRLHTVGGYIILTSFTVFYFQLSLHKINYIPLLIVAVFVWFLRLTLKKFNRS